MDLFHSSGGKEVIPRDGVNYNADGMVLTECPSRDCGRSAGSGPLPRLGYPVQPLGRSQGKGRSWPRDRRFGCCLIVTGSTLRAEEMDRPLGYYLKQRIEHALSEAAATGRRGLDDYLVRVVADFRWIHDEPLQALPTISLGGPGVNALAHRWLEDVPISLAYSERYFIQMDPDLTEPRVSIWGMDNTTTQIAVSVFVDRFLPRFLERCATITAHLTSLDGDNETETGIDVDDDNDDD